MYKNVLIDFEDIDMIKEDDTQKLNSNLSESLVYSIVIYAKFLRGKGYSIPVTSVVSFCNMLEKFDVINKKEFMLISKSLFCSTRLEYDSYESLFNQFFSFDERVGLKAILEKKQKESKEEIERLETELAMDLDSKMTEIKEKAIEIRETVLNSRYKVFKTHKDKLTQLNEEDNEELIKIIDTLDESDSDKEFIKSLVNFDKSSLEESLKKRSLNYEKYIESLEKIMLLNFESKNMAMISEVLIESANTLSKIDSEINKNESSLQKEVIQRKDNAKEEVNKLKGKQKADLDKVKAKLATLNHRKEYKEGHNSIIEIIKNCDKSINSLSKTEYESLSYYIKLNSSKFRTKIGRSMRRHKNKRFDVKKTIQESIKFNGNAINFYYKKPIVKKYKLVCVLDISGSVSKYLELLTSFIFEVSAVFNGGIDIYGFVSDLMDFTSEFRNGNVQDVISSVTGHRGYSSYEKAIGDFHNEVYKKIDQNTIILYFGDARNNKNSSKASLLKDINSKARYSVWLNPEERIKWDTGDSIMGDYSPCVNKTYCVNKTHQLIDFLNEFSIEK